MYTVDRMGFLNSRVTATAHHDLNLDVGEDLSELMPANGGAFGDRYRYQYFDHMSHIEAIWEAVRRLVRPDAPSRFECLFGVETLAEARAFRDTFSEPGRIPQIFVVDRPNSHAFRADMTLLDCSAPVPVTFARAKAYWTQAETRHRPIGTQPFYELLIPLPVTVGDKVE